mgnify:CR=1 FL=1
MTHHARWFIVAFLCLIAAGARFMTSPLYAESLGATRYVDATTGSDAGNNCLNPDAPCRTIQRAINQAANGDTILVASAIYTYAGTDNPCDQYLSGVKAVACIINKELTLRGGYPSGDWSWSDPAAHPTIIDGEGRLRGVYVLSSDPNRPSQARIEMEGFTIRHGMTQGAASGGDAQTFAFGGGMLTDYAAVVLRNMRFEENTAIGGGSQNVYGGSASGGGAAIRRAPWRATLENLVFVNNRVEGGTGRTRGGYGIGGGLFLLMSEVDGFNLEFYFNTAQGGSTQGNGQTPDGERGDGAGAGVTVMGYADVNLHNVVARGNRTIGGNATTNAGGAFGGAIAAEGLPMTDLNGDGVKEAATLRVFGCDLTDNLAQGGNAANGGIAAGGALETIHTTLLVERCNIQNNTSQGGNGSTAQGPAGGGGIYLQNIFYADPTATVKNSIIAFNSVSAGSGPAVGGGGGGIWLQGIEATIVHNTIAGNHMLSRPLQGAAIIVLSDGVTHAPKPAYIRDNIIANHTDAGNAALHVKPSNTANLAYNLFFGNASNVNSSQVGVIDGMNTSILGDPRFTMGAATGSAENFRISSSSAAVNQAIDSDEVEDFASASRNGVPDIGAYESAPFQVWVAQVASETLHAYWGQQAGIGHYRLTITCPTGARRPAEVECNASITYPGNADGAWLTRLTNYATYDIAVTAYDPDGAVLLADESEAMPTDIFVYTPMVAR